LFRIRQVLAHVAPLQDIPTKEPERANLGDDGPHGKPPLLQKKQMVASELGRADPIETRIRVLAERLNDLDVAADIHEGTVVLELRSWYAVVSHLSSLRQRHREPAAWPRERAESFP
jgi:hypothetical protein